MILDVVNRRPPTSANAVAFCVKDSKVSFEFTIQVLLTTGWSVKFCPTDGRSSTLAMPRPFCSRSRS
jgi:hypothetical protein